MKNNLYVYGESRPRKRFFVMDESINGDGACFSMSFFDENEAISEADHQWRYLTDREKRNRRIYVGYIDEEDAPDDVYGEICIIGNIDPEDWDSSEDDFWYQNFSMYSIIYECGGNADA